MSKGDRFIYPILNRLCQSWQINFHMAVLAINKSVPFALYSARMRAWFRKPVSIVRRSGLDCRPFGAFIG